MNQEDRKIMKIQDTTLVYMSRFTVYSCRKIYIYRICTVRECFIEEIEALNMLKIVIR